MTCARGHWNIVSILIQNVIPEDIQQEGMDNQYGQKSCCGERSSATIHSIFHVGEQWDEQTFFISCKTSGNDFWIV